MIRSKIRDAWKLLSGMVLVIRSLSDFELTEAVYQEPMPRKLAVPTFLRHLARPRVVKEPLEHLPRPR